MEVLCYVWRRIINTNCLSFSLCSWPKSGVSTVFIISFANASFAKKKVNVCSYIDNFIKNIVSLFINLCCQFFSNHIWGFAEYLCQFKTWKSRSLPYLFLGISKAAAISSLSNCSIFSDKISIILFFILYFLSLFHSSLESFYTICENLIHKFLYMIYKNLICKLLI